MRERERERERETCLIYVYRCETNINLKQPFFFHTFIYSFRVCEINPTITIFFILFYFLSFIYICDTFAINLQLLHCLHCTNLSSPLAGYDLFKLETPRYPLHCYLYNIPNNRIKLMVLLKTP